MWNLNKTVGIQPAKSVGQIYAAVTGKLQLCMLSLKLHKA